MIPFLQINDRKIGYDYDPVVIAEIGINHEGSLKTAFEMVDAAHTAGAEIIKHQTHVVEDEMSGDAKSVIAGNANISIYEIMHRCSLNEEDERALMEYVQSKDFNGVCSIKRHDLYQHPIFPCGGRVTQKI